MMENKTYEEYWHGREYDIDSLKIIKVSLIFDRLMRRRKPS